MARVFEVGKQYGAMDAGVPVIKVLKRTAKMITVKDTDCETVWKMRIKTRQNGDEYATDSSVPKAWRECYTYDTRFEI